MIGLIKSSLSLFYNQWKGVVHHLVLASQGPRAKGTALRTPLPCLTSCLITLITYLFSLLLLLLPFACLCAGLCSRTLSLSLALALSHPLPLPYLVCWLINYQHHTHTSSHNIYNIIIYILYYIIICYIWLFRLAMSYEGNLNKYGKFKSVYQYQYHNMNVLDSRCSVLTSLVSGPVWYLYLVSTHARWQIEYKIQVCYLLMRGRCWKSPNLSTRYILNLIRSYTITRI